MPKEGRLVQLLMLVLGCVGQHFRTPNGLSLLPQDPLIPLGDPIQFNCSMNCPKVIFTWKGLDTRSGSIISASQYSLLSIASTAVHNAGRIICEGICQGRRMQKTSQLNIYSFPDTMQLAQHPAHLMCSIRRVYPLDALVLRWYQGDHKLHTEEQQDISDEDDEKDEVQSYQLRLDLPEGVATKGTTYRCEAELHLGEATIQRNKTMTLSMPDGQTTGIKNTTAEEQSMMEMPITEATPSTKSESSKEQAATGSETLRANHATQTSITNVDPTTETAAIKVNLTTVGATTRVSPTTVDTTTRVNPTTDTATARVNATTDTVTARMEPTTETATIRVNPTSKAVATRLNPTTEFVSTVVNPTTETVAIRVIATSETVKTKQHTIPGMYGIKEHRSNEINQATNGDINGTLNTKLKPITAKELDTTSVPYTIPKETATLTVSRLANPTITASPKPGVYTESVAIWSVFSVLGLLSSSVGLHQLWKRLRFLDPKKGSFDLGQV